MQVQRHFKMILQICHFFRLIINWQNARLTEKGHLYPEGLKPGLSTSILYKNSMPLSVACFLISLRFPFRSNFFTHILFPLAIPIKTLPTGDLFVPPVGPATPVVDNPNV